VSSMTAAGPWITCAAARPQEVGGEPCALTSLPNRPMT